MAQIVDIDFTNKTITLDKTLSNTAIDGIVITVYKTSAKGDYSHAEGHGTDAYGEASHAEGAYTNAAGSYSHAEGKSTDAYGESSHAEGSGTYAMGNAQHVQGKFNITNDSNAHIVGNGNNNTSRSNAHTLDWYGNAWFAGDVYVGSTSGTNKDTGSKKLATEEYVDAANDVFIAEYGTTTYQEIWDAVEDGKTVLCNYTLNNNDMSSVFTLSCCHLDEIRFNGDTRDGRRQIVCKNDNTWLINSTVDVMTPNVAEELAIELLPSKMFYYANPPLQLTIQGNVNLLPNGWTGFLTVYATTPTGDITTSILETTSENGFTFSDIGNMESYSMAMFKTGASTKLKWYLFKSFPSAEGVSF